MDVQERLVYRTYIYIRTDILQYSAAQGDLAYPEKLEMMEVRLIRIYFILTNNLESFMCGSYPASLWNANGSTQVPVRA
jgi:hypothetical protein